MIMKPGRYESISNVKLDRSKIEIHFYDGMPPQEIVDLRYRVYCDETNLLDEHEIVSEHDELGTHFCLYYEGKLIGTILGVKTEDSIFPEWSGVPKVHLCKTYYASRGILLPEYRHRGLFFLLMYLIGREARILDRDKIVAYMEGLDTVATRVNKAQRLNGIPPRRYRGNQGREYLLYPVQMDVGYGLYRCWEFLSAPLRDVAAKYLLADEVIRTVKRLTHQLYCENPYFHCIAEGRLTRTQYIEFLANSHQFVRWTTRILARIAGVTHHRQLRNHYLSHLSGEIDHETIIESDLTYLGAEVAYVLDYMVPSVDIGHFRCVQESMAAFHADPFKLLAVPIAIEGLTAHLSDQFLSQLEDCIASWGYDEPKRATAYLRSHTTFDGGEDGHWEHTKKQIETFLKTEADTREFILIVRMVLTAMDRALASYVEQPDLLTYMATANPSGVV